MRVSALVLNLLVFLLSGCSAVVYNLPGIEDYRRFPAREVHTTESASPLVEQQKGIPPAAEWGFGKKWKEGYDTETFFQKSGTIAFLILRGDTIAYEYYAEGYDQRSIFTTFSLAKSYIGILTGIAIHEGFIDSVRQSVADFIPEFNTHDLRSVTIEHLLQMTSGLHSPEGFLPWSNASKLYYGRDVMKVVHRVRPQDPPGTRWDYLNLNTQLLGLVIEKATGKPIAQYLEEKIWKPLGMEADASWSLDHEGGHEKAFCCLNARARDYARFGLLMLNNGNWNGTQIVPAEWIARSTSDDTLEASPARYQYLWYTSAEQKDYYGEGLLGQFTYICPSQNTVIIRLGRTVHAGTSWYDMFRFIAGMEGKPVQIEASTRDLQKFAGDWVYGVSDSGDSTLYGKIATIRAVPNGLKVRTEFKQHFSLIAAAGNLFYEEQSGRRLQFELNEEGIPVKIFWSRRGNSWELVRPQ